MFHSGGWWWWGSVVSLEESIAGMPAFRSLHQQWVVEVVLLLQCGGISREKHWLSLLTLTDSSKEKWRSVLGGFFTPHSTSFICKELWKYLCPNMSDQKEVLIDAKCVICVEMFGQKPKKVLVLYFLCQFFFFA